MKKLIYGVENFIDVGGKLEVDAPDHRRKKARAGQTVEPVLFHCRPAIFWTEMLDAFNIGVIDLCPGKGTCAMACFRKLTPTAASIATPSTRHASLPTRRRPSVAP